MNDTNSGDNNWHIEKKEDDHLAFRISIGKPREYPSEGGYIVYRGDKETIIKILEKALEELKNA